MPAREELPQTLKRSSAKAQRTWSKVHDRAVESYGEGERAHRTAYAALKHSFEKVEDHWEEKETKGPSDPRSRRHYPEQRDNPAPTFGGVDVEGHTREELYQRARRLGVKGRARMTKYELADAIRRKEAA
jgi:cation transport regulator ChaB